MDDRQPILQALQELSQFAAGIIPSYVRINPEKDDAMALVNDLTLFARKVDQVVLAYGDYAASNFNSIDLTLFENQLFKALEGQALFDLEQAGEMAEEEMEEFA